MAEESQSSVKMQASPGLIEDFDDDGMELESKS